MQNGASSAASEQESCDALNSDWRLLESWFASSLLFLHFQYRWIAIARSLFTIFCERCYGSYAL